MQKKQIFKKKVFPQNFIDCLSLENFHFIFVLLLKGLIFDTMAILIITLLTMTILITLNMGEITHNDITYN